MSDQVSELRLVQTEIHDEMKTSYIDYAMSVIVGRALPDARDGLKPVHRRILYGMSELGLTPDKAFKKCARIVGDVMGKYHPHGDSSVYDALVRMAQDFSIRYELVDGHGNFGNVDGDSAAAMRYTEAKMTPFAMLMLRDIEKNTVDFTPNFDGDEEEPSVLPSRFPNLLVNGSNGIAVGMATSIPPHNLGEVIDACVAMIEDSEISGEELCKYVKGPDFPTGAVVLGKKGAREAYLTGRGKVTVRAKSVIEETKSGKTQIIFTEIPYQITKARVVEKIAALIKEKKIEGISALRDESNRLGIRIVLELKKDANPQVILNRLYKQTQLQDTYSMINIALVDGEPKVLTLKEMLTHYISHQKDVVTRRTKFDLEKAEARAHILEGLIIALDNIDQVIKTIRESYNDAKLRLVDRFKLTEIQAQAILDMRLARLQGLEREKLEAEYKELMGKIAYFRKILADEAKLMDVIKTEITEIKDKYADKRRTQISASATEIEEEDLIQEEQIAITMTHLGYIKRLPADTYRTQGRGGKGITGVTMRDNDFVKNIIITSSHNNLMFFTNQGKVYKIKGYEIPEASRTAKGTPVVNFLNLNQTERVMAVLPISEFKDTEYIMSVTKKGTVKKTSVSHFESVMKNGKIALKLNDGDELVGIEKTSGTNVVVLISKEGKAMSFYETDIRASGRTATGVKGMRLIGNDEIISMALAEIDEQLLVVTAKGYGKRTRVTEYPVKKRGGKGVITYARNKFDKTGELIGAITLTDDDEIILINSDGIIIRIDAKSINPMSRSTQGVKIMRVEEDSKIIALSKVESVGDEE